MPNYTFTLKDHESAVMELLIKNLASIQAANDTIIELLANIHGINALAHKEMFDKRVKVNFQMILEDLYKSQGDAKSDIENRITAFVGNKN